MKSMKCLFKDKDDELFSIFLIKEQEIKYLKKIYNKMTKVKKNNYIFKIILLIKYFLYSIYSYLFVKKNINKYDLENSNRIIRHDKVTSFNFKFHFFIKKYMHNISFEYKNKNFLQIKYDVFIIIEYVYDGSRTPNTYFLKTFSKYKYANIYFSKLKNKCRMQNGRFIIEYLLKNNEKKCYSLRKKIKYIYKSA